MIFLVVDIDNYDLLLRLDFLMKIGAIMDVEKGFIHVCNDLVWQWKFYLSMWSICCTTYQD
jgi:hypothetical protein